MKKATRSCKGRRYMPQSAQQERKDLSWRRAGNSKPIQCQIAMYKASHVYSFEQKVTVRLTHKWPPIQSNWKKKQSAATSLSYCTYFTDTLSQCHIVSYLEIFLHTFFIWNDPPGVNAKFKLYKKKLNKNNYNYLNYFYENFKKLIKITNMPKATLPDDEK